MNNQDRRLHIYKASAGAGKTHTMTEEFLRYVLQSPKSNYREVQAVTFTNLATGELKQRFFKELDTLARVPEESPFFESFRESFPSPEALSDAARTALKEILFDYGGLRVKTIDSFFQDIIHALAIELKQRPSTRIELSTDQILSLAVERLFEMPSDGAQKAIKRFLDTQEDKSIYSLRNTLTKFAKQLYNEQIQDLLFQGKDLFNPVIYDNFVTAVEKRIKELQGEICSQVAHFRTLTADMLKEDFPGKSQSPLFRLQDTTKTQPTIGASDSFITKTTWGKYQEQGNIEDSLLPKYTKGIDTDGLIIQTFYAIVRLYADINTLQVAIKRGYEIQLLGEIQHNVEEAVQELGVTLLDDAKRLIRSLVGHPDSTAFIYERLGTRLSHHMIDEFQDTSRFQYENFKPLLYEALAAGGDSFIVGDVKQSIYRFRSSDPMLLQEKLPKDFYHHAETKSLEYNWRSAPAIVSFNNRFFSLLPRSTKFDLDNYIADTSLIHVVYSPEEVHQEIPSPHREKPGGVFVHHCTAFNSAESKAQDKLQNKIDYLLRSVIPSILGRGYKMSDTAILTPKNETLQRIAEAIILRNKELQSSTDPAQRPLAFISREMLTLDANPLYRLIVDILHSILVNAGASEELYAKSFEHRLAVAHYEELSRSASSGGAIPPTLDLTACYREGLSSSLYELLLLIVASLTPLITPADQPYIDALLDTVQDYSQDNYVDLQGFLEWLESHTPRLTLETQDALQLLTMHSAKGLGFPVVCLLEYKMKGLDQNDTIWLRGEDIAEPLQELLDDSVEIPTLLPISPSNDAKATPFRPHIAQEETSALLDRINTLYVAMTRAKSEMHLILDEEQVTVGKSLNFETLVSQLASEISDTASSEGSVAEIQEIPLHSEKREISTDTLSVTQETILAQGISLSATQAPHPTADGDTVTAPRSIPRIEGGSKPAELRVRRHQSIAYQESDAVRNGLFLHTLLSEIDYLDSAMELRQLLKTKSLQGLLPQGEEEQLATLLEQALTDPKIAKYYQRSGGWQVINERSMVRINRERTRIERPDRIMYDSEGVHAVIIDYKSGDEADNYSDRHRRQLHNYRDTLLESGFQTVRAYLLYLSPAGHHIVEVS